MKLSSYLFLFFLCSLGYADTAVPSPSSASVKESPTPNQKELPKEADAFPYNEETYKIPDGKSVPKMEIIDADHIRIGEVTLNKKEKSFSIPAWVNMQEGLIEYLVSMPHGKVHETLLITMADPLHMSVACKLLKFPSYPALFPQRDENMEWKPFTLPKRENFKNSLMEITVSWTKDGKTISMPASDLLRYKDTKQYLASHEWVLNDSSIYRKCYQASVIGDIVAIFGDSNALISYSGFGNDGENVWMADSKKVPVPGTKVIVTFKKLPKQEADKPVSRRPHDISVPSSEHYLD